MIYNSTDRLVVPVELFLQLATSIWIRVSLFYLDGHPSTLVYAKLWDKVKDIQIQSSVPTLTVFRCVKKNDSPFK